MLDRLRVRKPHPLAVPVDTSPDLSSSATPADPTPGTPLGRVTIGDDVVAQVVGLSVLERDGVVGMASQRLQEGVAKLLGREAQTSGVVVTRTGPGPVGVALSVVMVHGLNLAEVAESLRARVADQVERLTGVAVSTIEVHTPGVQRTGE